MAGADSRKFLQRAGLLLLVVWAVLFLAGAAGELLGVEALSDLTDFRGGFLR